MQSFCNQINRDGSGPASMFNLNVNEFKPETQAPAEKQKEKTVNQMPQAPAFVPENSNSFQPTN